MTDVLVMGETLMDVIRTQDGSESRLPGGSAANVAVALARLGRSVTLHTCLGDDTDGVAITEWLAMSGVRVSITPVPRTAVAQATLDESGGATYDFSIDWAPSQVVPSAGVLQFGSLGALLEPGAGAVREAVDRYRGRALVAFDPNVRPQLTPDREAARRSIEHFVAASDVVKLSTEDAAWLYPAMTPREVLDRWAETGPGLVVLTDGAEGAHAATARGERLLAAAPRVRVVDTIGAGDTFQGCLIDGLVGLGCTGAIARARLDELDTDALESALRRAARAAAITVSRPGADPPTASELR
ncbi:carbohydrate kinase [Georgenia phoenicis]|uniref:carbohydrate kinase family protein n=1 Tax=unclassified Georgenia TaxID=2626815 RepID=UPI0039AFA9C9